MPIIGYIVLCDGRPMVHDNKENLLFFTALRDDQATMFAKRRKAHAAAKNSIRYAEQRGYPWPIREYGYVIVRILNAG